MKKDVENLLASFDKAAPTVANLEKFKQKIIAKWGELDSWPYLIDRAFEEFEISVKICAGEQKAA